MADTGGNRKMKYRDRVGGNRWTKRYRKAQIDRQTRRK